MKVVIFDCDGVLIDSEILADRVVLEYCADCFPEIDFSPWQAHMTGIMTRDILNGMEKKLSIQFPANADQAILQRLDETLHEQIQPIAGIANQTFVFGSALPRTDAFVINVAEIIL